jgi:PIN domain
LRAAYIDTSCLVSIAFGERGSAELARRIQGFDAVFSSNLLEAELRAAFVREVVDWDATLLSGLGWILPDRSLGPEMENVLSAGYVRGADLWHLACALHVAEDPTELAFVTLDARQAGIAGALGFGT